MKRSQWGVQMLPCSRLPTHGRWMRRPRERYAAIHEKVPCDPTRTGAWVARCMSSSGDEPAVRAVVQLEGADVDDDVVGPERREGGAEVGDVEEAGSAGAVVMEEVILHPDSASTAAGINIESLIQQISARPWIVG